MVEKRGLLARHRDPDYGNASCGISHCDHRHNDRRRLYASNTIFRTHWPFLRRSAGAFVLAFLVDARLTTTEASGRSSNRLEVSSSSWYQYRRVGSLPDHYAPGDGRPQRVSCDLGRLHIKLIARKPAGRSRPALPAPPPSPAPRSRP